MLILKEVLFVFKYPEWDGFSESGKVVVRIALNDFVISSIVTK
jgi:hypothetical protein